MVMVVSFFFLLFYHPTLALPRRLFLQFRFLGLCDLMESLGGPDAPLLFFFFKMYFGAGVAPCYFEIFFDIRFNRF